MINVSIGPCHDEEGREAVNLFWGGWYDDAKEVYHFLHGKSREEVRTKIMEHITKELIKWEEE